MKRPAVLLLSQPPQNNSSFQRSWNLSCQTEGTLKIAFPLHHRLYLSHHKNASHIYLARKELGIPFPLFSVPSFTHSRNLWWKSSLQTKIYKAQKIVPNRILARIRGKPEANNIIFTTSYNFCFSPRTWRARELRRSKDRAAYLEDIYSMEETFFSRILTILVWKQDHPLWVEVHKVLTDTSKRTRLGLFQIWPWWIKMWLAVLLWNQEEVMAEWHLRDELDSLVSLKSAILRGGSWGNAVT